MCANERKCAQKYARGQKICAKYAQICTKCKKNYSKYTQCQKSWYPPGAKVLVPPQNNFFLSWLSQPQFSLDETCGGGMELHQASRGFAGTNARRCPMSCCAVNIRIWDRHWYWGDAGVHTEDGTYSSLSFSPNRSAHGAPGPAICGRGSRPPTTEQQGSTKGYMPLL